MSKRPVSDSDRAAAEKVVHATIGWALNKDRDLLLGSVAHTPEFFIFHPDNASTIAGFDSFQKLVDGLFMSPDFRALSYEIKDLMINFSRDGRVAWYSALLDDRGEWKGQATVWENTRWTGVLEKLDDRWVVQQMHFSFAADAKGAA